MGAALTYARRYALFTLVGIAGEDDLDAPDLNSGMGTLPRPSALNESGQEAVAAILDRPSNAASIPSAPATASDTGRRKQVRPARVVLPADHSLALREKLTSELTEFTDTNALTAWAQRILAIKNQLTTLDAQEVETAFAAKLNELGDGVAPLIKPEAVVSAEVGGVGEPTAAKGNAILAKPGRKLNGSRVPRRAATVENGSVEEIPPETARQLVTPFGKELRLRDRDHLKFVSTQPCLACGRSPSDAHHLKFAQQRALGRKVSDEFTVPLCRAHHRELHQRGDERAWWQQLNVDPLPIAQGLWQAGHEARSLPPSPG
jgi:hypothetical protein